MVTLFVGTARSGIPIKWGFRANVMEPTKTTFSLASDNISDQIESATDDYTLSPEPLLFPLPNITSLIDGNNIIGNVSSLLDFAVVDFPKCGTTFLMYYLNKSDETFVHRGEVCDMDKKHPYKVANLLYEEHERLSRSNEGKRAHQFGLKCPEELETEHALRFYSQYFPKTKFIISLRHPVLW